MEATTNEYASSAVRTMWLARELIWCSDGLHAGNVVHIEYSCLVCKPGIFN